MATTAAPGRPRDEEHSPYFAPYIGAVPDGDVRDHLRTQVHETIALLSGVSDADAGKGYAPGKWSIKEVVGHICDCERVFAYRLLRIARGDETPLPGFDQDPWVPASKANARSMASLLLEFAAVRASTVLLVDSLDDEAWTRLGTASGKTISVRALAYVTAGHELHHRKIIVEKYRRA